MAQVCRFDEGSEGPLSVSRNKRRYPDLTIRVPGQVGDDIAQMLAIGELPGARKGDDKEPSPGLNGLEVVPRGIGRIGHHDHRLAPRGRHKRFQHLAKEGILRAIVFALFGFHQAKIQRNSESWERGIKMPYLSDITRSTLGRVCKLTMDPRHPSIRLFRKAASELLCKHALVQIGHFIWISSFLDDYVYK
jgi:hypothetical protein